MKKTEGYILYLCMDCVMPISRMSALYGGGRCAKCSHTGSLSGRWKNGINYLDSYILILSPKHPNKNKHGYVLKHRLVMEKKLGRYLTKKEIVHHLNGIRDDNRPENLALVTRKTHDTQSYTKQLQERIRKLEEMP